MKINYPNERTQAFATLNIGQLFLKNNILYAKITPCLDTDGYLICNAVCLDKTQFFTDNHERFAEDNQVTPISEITLFF